MRCRTEAACVEVPPHILHRNLPAVNLGIQFVEICLTYRAADDLADLREEYVGALYGLSVLVDLHVERLDIPRIIGHYHRFAEVLLNQVALVLRAQIVAPVAREFELMTVLDSLLQNIDTFGVG